MRLISIDVLRTVAIVMMVLVHFVENLSSGSGPAADTAIGPDHRWWLPTGLAAPLFALLSGVSYRAWLAALQRRGIASETISKRTIRRGLFLIGLGFAFNVFVWLPEDTFNWDILTLIGSALILLDVVRRMPTAVPPVLILLVVLLSPALQLLADYQAYWTRAYFDYDMTLTDVLLGYLVVGYFPIFPWLVFPVAGFVIAPLLLTEPHAAGHAGGSNDQRRLAFGVGLLALASLLLQGLAGNLSGVGRWTMFPASTRYLLGMLALAIASLLVLHRLLDAPAASAQRLPPTDRQSRLAACFQVISRHSLSLYLLHHVVHIWPLWIYGLATAGEPTVHWRTLLPVPVAVALAMLFCAVSVPLVLLADRCGWPTVEKVMRWLSD